MNRDTKDTPSTLHSTLMVESGQVSLPAMHMRKSEFMTPIQDGKLKLTGVAQEQRILFERVVGQQNRKVRPRNSSSES